MLAMPGRLLSLAILFLTLAASGCHSPYASDRLALGGAGVGAVTGAIIGRHSGNAAGGALLGAALGGATGAITGGAIDEAEARNRAAIEAGLGRPVPPGGVSVTDVVAMTKAGLPESVVVSHIESHGMTQPVGPGELIQMQNEGVSPAVMSATQRPPRAIVVPARPPGPVVIGAPCCGPYPNYHHRHYHYGHPRPRVGFGFSLHGH